MVKNQDYVSLHKKMEREIGGTVRIEYFVSVSMAKELAMVENNDKGSQARKYFIECEKQLKEQTATQKPIPLTFAEALRAYADEVEAHERTQHQLAIAEPKAQ